MCARQIHKLASRVNWFNWFRVTVPSVSIDYLFANRNVVDCHVFPFRNAEEYKSSTVLINAWWIDFYFQSANGSWSLIIQISDEKSDLEKVSWTRILLSYISIFSGCDHRMLWSLLGKECNNEGSKKQHQNSPQLLVFKQLLLASILEHKKAFCLALSRPVLEGFVLSLLSFLWVLLLKAFCWHNLFFSQKKNFTEYNLLRFVLYLHYHSL